MQNRERGWDISMAGFFLLFFFLINQITIKLTFEGTIVIKVVEEKRIKDKTTSRDRVLHS